MASLRQLLRQRIIDNIIKDAQSKMKKKYTVIVADDVTIKILHHCFRMHELNELDVGVVLNVKFPRERVKVSPIYFLSPNYDSAKFMCADYANPKETRYAAPVHVYFNSKVTKRIIELIKTENIRKYMKTFSEIHSDFLVIENRVFSFNAGYKSFNRLYVDKEQRSDELNERAQQLVGLCLTLNEEPNIRYSASSRNAKPFAELFNQLFNDTKSSLKNWSPNTSSPGTLIIIDRTDDPLTPLLHSLSFQPMVRDLLDDDIIENGTKIKNLSKKSNDEEKNNSNNTRPFPDESDQIWCKYRHTFIGEVVQKLPKQFNDWQKQNAVVQMKKSQKKQPNVNTKDLILAARDMPQYQKLVKQYTTNINMASKLMDIFKNSGLRDVVSLEQDMATGIDEDGKKVDRTKMQQQFCNQVLLDGNKDKILKLRVFMMYVISQGGMKPDQRKQLLKQSGFNEDTEDTICNLGSLGVTLQSNRPQSQSNTNKNYWKEVVKIAKSKVETTDITRYTSFLEWTLKSHLDSTLSEKDFPWISKPKSNISKPAVKSFRRHRQNKNNKNNDNNNTNNDNSNGPRIIIYILGGLSYSEIKTCYKYSKENDCDIFIGSTLIYSPKQYLNCFDKDKRNNDEQKVDHE